MLLAQSGLHFGHYASGVDFDLISDMHALKTSIALHHDGTFSRWKAGLCVVLEKSADTRLISKLWAILLIETDVNRANKILLGQCMLFWQSALL